MFVLNIIRRTYQGYLRVANFGNIILITGMINTYENMHIEINIESAVFKYDYKITTSNPLCLPILICTEHTKESNIFTQFCLLRQI